MPGSEGGEGGGDTVVGSYGFARITNEGALTHHKVVCALSGHERNVFDLIHINIIVIILTFTVYI